MNTNTQTRVLPILLVGILFFIFGFVTWLNGALIPFLKEACELSNFLSYFVTFAFYISYFFMAIPSSYILEKIGLKKGISVGLFIMALGALLFIPSAYLRFYPLFLTGLFLLGLGLALMQTAVNPYVTALGPLQSAAKRMSIMGVCNKFAGMLAPLLLAGWVLHDTEHISLTIKNATSLIEKESLLNLLSQRLIIPYLFIGGILLALSILVRYSRLPELSTEASHSTKNASSLFQHKHLLFGVLALFFYVGVEVVAGDTVIQYGQSLGTPMSSAKYFTSITLFSMLMGYFIGISLIPKYISQRKALTGSAILGLILTVCAILIPKESYFELPILKLATFSLSTIQLPYTVFFICLLGLANALVWPSIWPLALDGLGSLTQKGSALLIMAIAGGAVIPMIYGKLADHISAQRAYWIAIPCYLILLAFSTYGYKLGKNKC